MKQCRSLAGHGHEVSLVVADGLGDGCRDGIFMRIECTSGKGPRSATVSPGGAQLKKHMRGIEVGAYQQQTCCAVESPVAISAGAKHPSVTVSKAHRGNGDTEGSTAG